MAVQRLNFGGHGLAQHRHPWHRRVLVQAALHGAGDGVHQAGVAVEVRKPLAQVDGAFFGGQRGHDGEDGRAHLGQFGQQGRGAFGRMTHGCAIQRS